MIYRFIAALSLVFAVYGLAMTQDATCDQVALDNIETAQTDHGEDISALFAAIDNIRAEWEICRTSASAVETVGEETQSSASEVVDGGYVVEGLWQFQLERTLSDACEERKKKISEEFFEDVYYSDDGLLVWDAGNRFSNFTFEYLLARRYVRSEDGNHNYVYEYEIKSATETNMSGTYAGYWQGNRSIWCSEDGAFTADFYETDNACLVYGEANIRSNPSTKSPANGKIEGQMRAIDKVPGDDGYDWWQLSEDEYVREDVVGSSRSCERL